MPWLTVYRNLYGRFDFLNVLNIGEETDPLCLLATNGPPHRLARRSRSCPGAMRKRGNAGEREARRPWTREGASEEEAVSIDAMVSAGPPSIHIRLPSAGWPFAGGNFGAACRAAGARPKESPAGSVTPAGPASAWTGDSAARCLLRWPRRRRQRQPWRDQRGSLEAVISL